MCGLFSYVYWPSHGSQPPCLECPKIKNRKLLALNFRSSKCLLIFVNPTMTNVVPVHIKSCIDQTWAPYMETQNRASKNLIHLKRDLKVMAMDSFLWQYHFKTKCEWRNSLKILPMALCTKTIFGKKSASKQDFSKILIFWWQLGSGFCLRGIFTCDFSKNLHRRRPS